MVLDDLKDLLGMIESALSTGQSEFNDRLVKAVDQSFQKLQGVIDYETYRLKY